MLRTRTRLVKQGFFNCGSEASLFDPASYCYFALVATMRSSFVKKRRGVFWRAFTRCNAQFSAGAQSRMRWMRSRARARSRRSHFRGCKSRGLCSCTRCVASCFPFNMTRRSRAHLSRDRCLKANACYAAAFCLVHSACCSSCITASPVNRIFRH